MLRRDFTGPGDLRAMQSLAQRIWSVHSRWHIGDLTWGRYMHTGREAEWPTALWIDGDDLVAWGWAELPGDLSLLVDPAHPEVANDVLGWFDDVALGDSHEVTVLESESHLVDALITAGYREQPSAPFFIHHQMKLTELSVPTPPSGFTLRPIRPDEAAPRAAAHRAAFSAFGPSRVSTQSYLNLMAAWPYRCGLDWIAESPQGQIVAYSLGWLDEVNRVGELEPVGTDPAFRGLGLARAVNVAALRALRDAGADTAVVYPRGDAAYPIPARLYAGIGFSPGPHTVTYVR